MGEQEEEEDGAKGVEEEEPRRGVLSAGVLGSVLGGPVVVLRARPGDSWARSGPGGGVLMDGAHVDVGPVQRGRSLPLRAVAPWEASWGDVLGGAWGVSWEAS